jgi:hypothetical protein
MVPVFILFNVTSDVATMLLALAYFVAANIILGALFGKKMFVILGIEKRLRKLRIHEKTFYISTSLEDSANASALDALATLINEEDKLAFCKKQVLYWQARIIALDFEAIVGHQMISSRSDSGGSGSKPKADAAAEATSDDRTSGKNTFDNGAHAHGKVHPSSDNLLAGRASGDWNHVHANTTYDSGFINYRQANRADDVFAGTKLDLTLYDQNNNPIEPTSLSHSRSK